MNCQLLTTSKGGHTFSPDVVQANVGDTIGRATSKLPFLVTDSSYRVAILSYKPQRRSRRLLTTVYTLRNNGSQSRLLLWLPKR